MLDLRNRGLIPQPAAADLLKVLLDAYGTDPDDFPYDSAFGEVYNSRERYFVERIGDSAGWLHAGRPRREAARVALRLLLRSQTARLIEVGADFASTAAAVAADHAETFMGDQTYLQQAQPSTFGHYLLAFVPPALRDGDRFLAALEQVNTSPGGAGCVNGSRLLDDRGAIAGDLGFDGVIVHTRDAMWQTDVFIDLLATSASMIANQAKLAEDLEIWSSQEFDYVDLAGPFTRASVLMPQKRNPYSLSIIRGASGVLIGRMSGFLAVVKSPSARSDNLIFAYGEIPRALDFTIRVSALTTGVVRTLTVNAERMWSELERGFTQATDLAEYVMVAAGVDYRTAYHVVGRAVRAASRGGALRAGHHLRDARRLGLRGLRAAARTRRRRAGRSPGPTPDRGHPAGHGRSRARRGEVDGRGVLRPRGPPAGHRGRGARALRPRRSQSGGPGPRAGRPLSLRVRF